MVLRGVTERQGSVGEARRGGAREGGRWEGKGGEWNKGR